nr:histone-lysine N-methyltransferase CLF isoform X2 [Tanacetum cinerariifolium]
IVGPEGAAIASSEISLVIESLKKKVDADRCVYIKKRMEENRIKLAEATNNYLKLSTERRNLMKTVTALAPRKMDMLQQFF